VLVISKNDVEHPPLPRILFGHFHIVTYQALKL